MLGVALHYPRIRCDNSNRFPPQTEQRNIIFTAKKIPRVKLMKKAEIIKRLKVVIKKNNIRRAYLFGSFTRKRRKYNDIDIAIEAPEGFTLLDLSRVANRMEERTGIPVDVVTLRSMHPKIKKAIKKEMVAL
jgi:uncharacterized protein